MELMNWFIKPLDRFLMWLGTSVFDSTIFGIKLGWIVIYCSMMYMMFNLTDMLYDKGFDDGVKSVTIGVNNG